VQSCHEDSQYRKWQAFFWSLLSGLLIGFGIYFITGSVFIGVMLGLGLYVPNYFICVGLTSISNDCRRLLDERSRSCAETSRESISMSESCCRK
jgi:hypothetical protein